MSLSFTVSGIYKELSRRIAEKNARLPTYRENPPSSAVWLLLYGGAAVSNAIEIPYGIEDWRPPFDFDRVFFFSALAGRVIEICKADAGARVVRASCCLNVEGLAYSEESSQGDRSAGFDLLPVAR